MKKIWDEHTFEICFGIIMLVIGSIILPTLNINGSDDASVKEITNTIEKTLTEYLNSTTTITETKTVTEYHNRIFLASMPFTWSSTVTAYVERANVIDTTLMLALNGIE